MDRYVLFSNCTFMKHYDIFLDFFFRLTHKTSLMPRAYPGASMYYTLRHALPTSAFDIFLCSIICTSTTIIFIFWIFFHIYYFETLSSNIFSCVIKFANLLTHKAKKYADCGNPHTSCQKSYAKLRGNHIQHITAHLDILRYIAKLLQPICCSFKRHIESI